MHLLKSLFYALAAFLAAASVHLGPAGEILIQLPPLTTLTDNIDLYASGLLVLVEMFGRLNPSAKNDTLSAFLMRLLDQLLPNRAKDGGRFTLQSTLSGGPAE